MFFGVLFGVLFRTAAAEAEESGHILAYNPKRLMEVTRFLLELPVLAQTKSDLNEMTPEAITANVDEVKARYALLLELLSTTGGKRPSTVANMTNGELAKAKMVDGEMIVSVRNHKSFSKYVALSW